MATFTTTIQLNNATKQDYENLFSKLEKLVLKTKCHLVKSRQFVDGKCEYQWTGNVSIQEIAGSIFRSLSVWEQNIHLRLSERKQSVD
jgi:hypothetical protein